MNWYSSKYLKSNLKIFLAYEAEMLTGKHVHNRLLRRAQYLLLAPFIFITKPKFRKDVATIIGQSFRGGSGRTWYPNMIVSITTRCSLKCKHCSNLMCYYEKPQNVSYDTIVASLDRITQLCDRILELYIIGGEPFLNDQLADVLEYALSLPQITCVCINTNGTVPIKSERLLELLKNKRVRLSITDYGYGNVDEFCKILSDNGSNFTRDKTKVWTDYGNMRRRGKTKKELKKQFKKCFMLCREILDGKFHFCPRSANAINLGLVPDVEGDYLDLLDENRPVTREELFFFYYNRTEPLQTCDYCDYAYTELPVIPAGEQIKEPRKD